MIVKTIELILEKVETNQRLLKELTTKVESLVKPKKTKRTTNSLGNPKATTPKLLMVPKKPELTIDELIEIVDKTPETSKTEKNKAKKEVTLRDLITDLKTTS